MLGEDEHGIFEVWRLMRRTAYIVHKLSVK